MPHYLVVEVGPQNYVYDSRNDHRTDYEEQFSGKRTLLQHYLNYLSTTVVKELSFYEDGILLASVTLRIISIYEYALPTGRTQLVCWYEITPN